MKQVNPLPSQALFLSEIAAIQEKTKASLPLNRKEKIKLLSYLILSKSSRQENKYDLS